MKQYEIKSWKAEITIGTFCTPCSASARISSSMNQFPSCSAPGSTSRVALGGALKPRKSSVTADSAA